MKTFKFEVTMKVADLWIEDGFGAHNKSDEKRLAEQVQEAIYNQVLTWAIQDVEFKVAVKVIEHPDHKSIAKLQGYSPSSK